MSSLSLARRRDSLRTNLWFVPMLEVVAAVALYLLTHALDVRHYHGQLTLPSWMLFGSADAARTILTALAAAVITVVGIVFSITIVTLTLASTQFGPRMLRNFIRDRGTQFTLGTFVATFVYATLVMISVGPGDQVPHLSITVAVVLVTVSMGVLIYFIHHIATSIQLPNVIASIAGDLSRAIDAESSDDGVSIDAGPTVAELVARMDQSGGVVQAPASGYLQFVRNDLLAGIAAQRGAVIRLLHRPGHFIVRGHPIATVWPPETAPSVSQALRRGHITGPNRTLVQDLAFAVDQLVEIAIRALSPAVNDTFTALTCIDWLGESLCRVTTSWHPLRIHRDGHGFVRVITAQVSYDRLVERAFEKIRQASAGMPAVMIRQLDALSEIMEEVRTVAQRELLLAQAAKTMRLCERTVGEETDRADVERAYANLLQVAGRVAPRDASDPGYAAKR
jgi:uncharacterized membrane protein